MPIKRQPLQLSSGATPPPCSRLRPFNIPSSALSFSPPLDHCHDCHLSHLKAITQSIFTWPHTGLLPSPCFSASLNSEPLRFVFTVSTALFSVLSRTHWSRFHPYCLKSMMTFPWPNPVSPSAACGIVAGLTSETVSPWLLGCHILLALFPCPG